MTMSHTFDSGLDTRFAGSQTNERVLLFTVFIVMYIAFGAIGRDVFFNRLNSLDVDGSDPIGFVLPWIRLALCGIAVLLVVSSAGLTWSLSKVPLIFAPYCVFVLASTLWSVDAKATFRDSLALIGMWIAMPMLIHRLGLVRTVQASLHFIAVVVILSAFLAIFVPSIGRHTGLEIAQFGHEGRWRGLFNHKNALGPWAAYGTVFFLTHKQLCTGPRPYWWFAWVCAFLCLIFSGSATAVVAVGVLAWGWFFFAMLRREHLSFVLLINAVILAILLGGIYSFYDTILELLGRDSTLTGRTELWEICLDYVWREPWLGSGYLRAGGPDLWAIIEARFGQAIKGADNGYIAVLLDTGVIGAVLLFGPLIAIFKNGFEWLKYVTVEDRSAMEWQLMLLLAALVISVSDSNALICTGFDGVLSFAGFFALMTAPRSPDSRLRGEFRLAKYWLPPKRSQAAIAGPPS